MHRLVPLLIVGSMAMAAGAGNAPAPAPPELRQVSAQRFQLGTIELDKSTREIFLPAEVNMVGGTLEYAVVNEKGKRHEALLSTTARAFDLNVALLLLNYKPDEAWFVPPAKPKPLDTVKPEARVECFVRWKDAAGTEKIEHLESWITDISTGRPAASGPWVYSGSHLNDEKQFAAEVDGSLVALYLDARSLLNSPRAGADDDERWVPAKGIPPKGTAVTIVLKPAPVPAVPTRK